MYDVKKYKKIQDLFHKSDRKSSFKCKRCGQELKTFHSNHLKKCGITKEEYINEYGFPNSSLEKDRILNDVMNKMADLYIVNRNKWLILSGFTKSYITKDSDTIKICNKLQGRKEISKLTNYQVKEHLKGKNTVGVFPVGYNSKFLVFDIDSYIGLVYAEQIANSIRDFLIKYFPEEQVHISYSGNKGYHITLYFSHFVDIKELYKIFNIVLNEINIERYTDVRIEMRPTTKGEYGYGVKLPLGVNFVNNDNYNNYAYYVYDDFNEIEYEIEYVLNIKKSSSEIIRKILSDYKNTKLKDYGENYINEKEVHIKYAKYSNFDINLEGKVKYIIENGLETMGTRHYWSFIISMYLKESGLNANETYNFLYDWSLKQIENGLSTSSTTDIEKDLRNMIFKGVYSDNKNYSLHQQKSEYYLTKQDINLLIELNRNAKDTGIPMVNYQKVLFILLLYGRSYCDENGQFNLTYDKIHKHSGFGSRTTVNKCITGLDSMGYIKIISRNAEYDEVRMKKDPNVYQIVNYNKEKDKEIALTITFNEINCEDSFYKVMLKYFGKDNLDEIFTRAIRSKVIDRYVR